METMVKQKYKERLVNFYDDIVIDVVHVYFEVRILQQLTLFMFLSQHLHVLFHEYKSDVLCCQQGCKCPTSKRGRLNKAQFENLFDNSGQPEAGHEKTLGRRVTQYCLCAISPRSSGKIKDMDITLINALIKACCPSTYPGNPKLIEDIKNTRDSMFHLGDSLNISAEEFEKMWEKLETSALGLANVVGETYGDSTRKHIAKLKNRNTEADDWLKATVTCNASLEKNLMEYLQKFGIRIDNLEFIIKQVEIGNANMTEREAKILQNEDSGSRIDTGKCIVVWKFAAPGNWNVPDMVDKLTHVSALMPFKTEFVYEGSLVVITSTSFTLLTDKTQFSDSIQCYLQNMVKECAIDTSIKEEVNVDLTIFYIPNNDRDDFTTVRNLCKDKDELIERKDVEITRLQKELEDQLQKTYESVKLEMSCISFSTFGKDLYIEKPLDDLLAKWEREEDIFKSIESSYGATLSPTSEEKWTAISGTDTEDNLVCKDAYSKSITKQDSSSGECQVTELDESKLREDELTSQRAMHGVPRFSKASWFEFAYEEHIAVNGIAVTPEHNIIICNVCTNRLLLMNEEGTLLGDCYLLDNPWNISLFPSLVSSKPQERVKGIVTIPEMCCYQYFIVCDGALQSGKCVLVDDTCFGVKVTDELILIGVNQFIRIFNRNDKYLTYIPTRCGVFHIDLYGDKFSELLPNKVLILSDQDEICSIESETEVGSIESETEVGSIESETEVGSIESETEVGSIESETEVVSIDKQDRDVKLSCHSVDWLRIKFKEGPNDEKGRISALTIGRHNQIFIASDSLNSVYCVDGLGEKKQFSEILDDTKGVVALCFSENYDKLYTATMNGRQIVIWNNNEYVKI